MVKYYQENLMNGGKLYYVKNILSKTTKVEIQFDCGARCDTIPGLAHFTEHMFFCGTKTMSSQEVYKKYFDFIDVNAYTNQLSIVFSGNVFTKEFEEYIKTVAMLITESTFTQKAIDKELEVIKQEIAMYRDKFNSQASDRNDLNITGNKTYKDFSVIGTEETISTIKSKDIKSFVKKYFIANNMHVYVTSPLKLKKVKYIVEKNLSSKLNVNTKFEPLPLHLRYVKNTKFFDVENRQIEKCYYNVNFYHPNYNIYDWTFKAKYTLILSMINDTADGVMHYLREKEHLVYGGYFYCGISNEKEYLTTFTTDINKENINRVSQVLAKYIKDIATNGFTQEQLNKAKRMFTFEQDTKEPTARSRMRKLKDFRTYGKITKNIIRKLAKKVTLEECNKLFKDLFDKPQVSLSIFGNANKKEILTEKEFFNLF